MDLTKPTPISIARNDKHSRALIACEQIASRSDEGLCAKHAWHLKRNLHGIGTHGIFTAFSRTWFSRGKQLRHHQVLHFDALISIKIPSDTEKSASQKGDKQSFQVTKISGIILESHICCYLPVLRCSHRVRAHLLASEGIWARAPWTPKSWIKQEWNQRLSCSYMYF